MGLYSMMRTSSSGMGAQANRLATVADNIGNSSTVGYKRASTEFSSILLQSGTADYTSGSVETEVRYHISEQGSLRYSTSATDLAVTGQGFFIVENSNGQSFFTRAGSFVKDGEGNLVNAGGFKLMGYDLALGSTPAIVANGVSGLVPVNVGSFSLRANPSTEGNLYFNLPSNDAVVVAANLPAANAATAEYSGKTSLVTYDSARQRGDARCLRCQERHRRLADQRVRQGQRRRQRWLPLHRCGDRLDHAHVRFIGPAHHEQPDRALLHHSERRSLHARPVEDQSSSRPSTAS